MTALPRTPKRAGVAADHGGYDLKAHLAGILREAYYEVIDFGDGHALAWEWVKTLSAARFSGAVRHRRRLSKVAELENRQTRS